MSSLVSVRDERGGQWQRLILTAPPGNLLSMDMIRALRRAIADVERRHGLKWLTIEGGAREFSFGADIREHTREAMAQVLPATHALLKQLLAVPAPTAALVDGRCLGGGFELAMACDDIIATEGATFGLPEIKLGAFPPAAAALLPLRVGASRATRAIVTGQLLDAGYWHDTGLISLVSTQATLIDAAQSWFDSQLAPHSAAALEHAVLASRATLRAPAAISRSIA